VVTEQLQILQLNANSCRDAVEQHSTWGRGDTKGNVMYVFTIHTVSDPAAFWSGQLPLPDGTELPIVVPSSDGKHGVCVFKSDSLDTVRDLVDGATGAISKNEYYAINETNALGLPV
jgi:hypothetical protein